MKQVIRKLVAGKNLSRTEAARAMDMVLDNGATLPQISAFLTLLRSKGETVDEIVGCAAMLKQKACHIHPNAKDYVDLVGTGGDGANTFNISTTSAFVVAGAGVPVAKHGNRAISSRSGSVDVLEELGVNVMISPSQVTQCVNQIGIGFMIARTFHKNMKNVAVVRSDLGIRTIFNILGPISNPSDAKCQVIGVFDESLVHPLAEAIMEMGVERGVVMCSNGIDEFTTLGNTVMSRIHKGCVTDSVFHPQDYGFSIAKPEEIAGGTAAENAIMTKEILSGEKSARRDVVVLNAGMTIYMQGSAQTIAEGIEKAAQAIDTGAAMEKLNRLIYATNQMIMEKAE